MLKKYTELQASDSYNSVYKIYNDGTFILSLYDKLIYSRNKNFVPVDDSKTDYIYNQVEFKKEDNKKDNSFKSIRSDSLARTRNTLIDYVIQNKSIFKSFITLTFRENLKDLDVANDYFNKWCLKIRRKFPNFAYISVPEFQKRGAVHYHLLTNLTLDNQLIYHQNEFDKTLYDVKYWYHGFASVFFLDTVDENFNLALYITKYLYKDINDRLFGRKKILKSNNLSKPIIYKLKNDDLYVKTIDYLIKKEYDVSYHYVEQQQDNPYSVGKLLLKCNLNQDDLLTLSSMIK